MRVNGLVLATILGGLIVVVQPQLVKALSPVEVGAIASYYTQLLAQSSTVNSTPTPDINKTLSASEVGKIGKSIKYTWSLCTYC
ncbi:hypothetical protein [Merismopedia glauca]|uniref:Uncharacterized protein n=1 Tax=Merismopedia glauca CCAP 1448/3 TaxID=1296344 RepID=A0A2T1CAI5_9CYAN|nr:hypothetical protein [Merismopedia glauca]PSB05272.1 hypothetical protein C7B64_00265 [Merismopedia glauca CCAP 1448/3]